MDPWTKLVRARPGVRSRFHTERNEPLPLASLRELPVLLARRIGGREPIEPWMTRGAISYLDSLLSPSWRLLEFGSGRSTAWFAQRVAAVISFEADPDWYALTQRLIIQTGAANVDLRLRPLDAFLSELRGFPDQTFDVAVIDAGDDGGPTAGRVRLAEAARSKLQRGGLLVVDNTDRPRYRQMEHLLDGWPARRFTGLHAKPLHATETSVFQRP